MTQKVNRNPKPNGKKSTLWGYKINYKSETDKENTNIKIGKDSLHENVINTYPPPHVC